MTRVIENFAAQSYSDLSGGSMNGMVLCSLVQRQVAGSQALLLLQGCATHNVFKVHVLDKTRRWDFWIALL